VAEPSNPSSNTLQHLNPLMHSFAPCTPSINQPISTQYMLVSQFPVSSSTSLSKASCLTFSSLYRSLASTGSLASFCQRRSFVVGLYRIAGVLLSAAFFCRWPLQIAGGFWSLAQCFNLTYKPYQYPLTKPIVLSRLRQPHPPTPER
jgi:hypothetical protein